MDKKSEERAMSLFSMDNMSKIEKVRNSIRKSLPAIGIQYNTGVLLVSHAWNQETRLMKKDDIKKIRRLTDKVAATFAGRSADGQRLIRELRKYAMEDYDQYGEIADIRYNVEKVSDEIVNINRDFISRPLGVELLVGGVDKNGPALYDIEPDGTVTSWSAYVIGENQPQMLEVLEESYESNCSFSESLNLAIQCLSLSNKELKTEDIQACRVEESGFRRISNNEFIDIEEGGI